MNEKCTNLPLRYYHSVTFSLFFIRITFNLTKKKILFVIIPIYRFFDACADYFEEVMTD